ncbi:MAG: DNA topoisomerase III, partial [Bacteroides sp.]
DAHQFLEELKQMVSEIVFSVLSDNTNRRITIQEAVEAVAEEKKAEPKKRTRKPAAPKEKKPKAEAPAATPDAAPTAPQATAPASPQPAETEVPDAQVGRPCPLCGQGTVIKGKAAYGCSRWKEGCTFRQAFE